MPRSAATTTGSLVRRGGRRVQLVGGAGDEGDAGAGGVEGRGDRRADAATRPGDDRRAPVERAIGQSDSVIVTELMTTSSAGGRRAPVRDALHRVDDVEALHDLAEQAVLRRQADAVGPDTMKNWLPLVFGPALAIATEPIWYWPRLGQLVVEAVAGAAAAGAGRVAALAHEAVDDAVEDDAVVVVVQRRGTRSC